MLKFQGSKRHTEWCGKQSADIWTMDTEDDEMVCSSIKLVAFIFAEASDNAMTRAAYTIRCYKIGYMYF